jgi:hypothetical protein
MRADIIGVTAPQLSTPEQKCIGLPENATDDADGFTKSSPQ